jgi:predicted SAM-dependent methyltransferase
MIGLNLVLAMKLHLGCGKRFIPGYSHIDAVEFPHVDHVSTVDRLDFIQDNSVDVIYTCHVLEHFKRANAKAVLAEWRRVLAPGGTLRLAVPDFEALVELYSKTKQIELVIGPIVGRQDYLYNFHYNIFDFNSLCQLLMASGFEGVRRYDWRHTEHCNIDDYSQAYYPHLDKKDGMLLSLNVEATKPH